MPALNDKFVSVLGKLVKVVKNGIQSLGRINPKYTINTFLIVLSGLILFFVFNWFKNEQTVKIVNEAVERVLIQNQRADMVRDSLRKKYEGPEHYIHTAETDADINEELKNLLDKVDADRVMLSSFHNHEEGVMLGYLFYDEAYEKTSTKRHILPVAYQYQRERTSLTPLVAFLWKNQYYQASYKKISEIDLRYSHHMEEDGSWFGAWYFVWSKTGRPIGILTCAWNKENRRYIPTAEKLEMELRIYGETIRNIVDNSAKRNNIQQK